MCSQFKGPEAGRDWTCSGHIPEASAAQEGGAGALGMRTLCMDLVLDGSPVCPWSQPLLNRHHPVSLRRLCLTVRVLGQPTQGGRKEWGREVGAMGGVTPALGVARFCLDKNRLGVRVKAGISPSRLLKQRLGAVGAGTGVGRYGRIWGNLCSLWEGRGHW